MLTLQEVLYSHPDLTEYGFGTFEDPKDTKEQRAIRFEKDREALKSNIRDFNRACDFMEKFETIKSISIRYGNSYLLKHVFEQKEGGYMANGVLIAAGIAIGLKFRKHGSSAFFNISSKSHKRVVNS